jgi:uroporphyrinogen III methyltransferase/synthase
MSARSGVVYLVGAGPGDPGLMTARSLELIAAADTIFYDRLIPPGALDGARDDAELVYVGKDPKPPADGPKTGDIGRKSAHRPGGSVPQEETNARLVEAARAGRSVVRLKGGDPFVFGRGGEEGEALRAAGVEFEVVPGVTAGVAAPAYAGIPVTHRDDASAVAFVTGHEDPEKGKSALDWEALARFPGTLVFYMGVKQVAENAAALVEGGRDPGEAAAAIERGTWPGQRTVSATLGTIAETVEHESIKAPALIVVGPVAARRADLAWLERRPLHGRRVVVTRARAQASGLAATLRELGAEVVELPAIRIEPRLESEEARDMVASIGEYSLICVTSPNGAGLLFEALKGGGETVSNETAAIADGGGRGGLPGSSLDARALANAMVAAIGPGTARALARHGITADVVPERFVAEALVEALAGVEVEGKRVLVARAAEARDVLPDALRERGAEVDVVALYETVREQPDEAAVEAAQGADYVTFTSSSTVTNLTEALGDRFPRKARIVSIGPVTSEAARAAGLDVDVEAVRHDIDGLVTALLKDASPPETGGGRGQADQGRRDSE